MENLREKLKGEIIDLLNLEDVQPAEIKDDELLFGEGMDLDSIDALELIVLLEKNYGLKIENPEEGKKVFQSVNTIAAYIESHKA